MKVTKIHLQSYLFTGAQTTIAPVGEVLLEPYGLMLVEERVLIPWSNVRFADVQPDNKVKPVENKKVGQKKA